MLFPLVIFYTLGVLIHNVRSVSGYHAGAWLDKRSGSQSEHELSSSFIQQGNSGNLFYDDFFQLNCSIPICEGKLSKIYCTGYIIAASWYFGFQDTCPGSKLRFGPERVLLNFHSLGRPLEREQFKQFCEDNFEQVPFLKPAALKDWKETPKLFEMINDAKIKKFAVALNQIWPQLSREFVADVHINQNRYPVLSVPKPFVIPGGLFQVYFYWDTYWILKGLLFCEMFDTARGILENFAHILNHKPYIPNSGNIGLSRRSQPPLFTQMIWDFYQHFDGDRKAFLKKFLPLAERELVWWHSNRTVLVSQEEERQWTLYQYRAETNCPRPENFLEDYQLGLQSGMDPEFYWSSVASACESGLDFSTRWFCRNGIHAATRGCIETNQVVPVDLNVFMVLNYRTLARLFGEELGDKSKSEKYSSLADHLQTAINQLLLDPEIHVWFDYDLRSKQFRKGFYPSNVFPLLLNQTANGHCTQILGYLQGLGIFNFKGGIPSSLEDQSKEQWDFPNGWAPSNHLFVQSILNCQGYKAKQLAKQVADGFLTTVYNGLFNPIKGYPAQVWEKYDIRFDDGRSGFGGEYPVQAGFGWTNGAVLDFVRMFYTNKLDKQHSRKLFGGMPSTSLNLRSELDMVNHGPINSTMVLSALALCVMLVLLFVSVHLMWNRNKRVSSSPDFWITRLFGKSDLPKGCLDTTRMEKGSEHKLLLNTNWEDNSTDSSD